MREGRISRHSISRGVGIRSSWQVLGADFRMRFLTTDSETGCKVQSGAPSNGFVRGKELVIYRLRIKVASDSDDFVTKKGRE